MPEPPVLVTGGSGFVGGAIVKRLIHDGREVRALARSDAASDALARAGARPVRGNVLDERSLRAAMAGCSTVFHAAGVNAMCLRDPEPMVRTNVEGAVAVVGAAASSGVRRVIHTSSAAAIGEAAGTVGREDTPHRGSYLSAYERSKHESERAVFELGARSAIEVVCVNPSSVQGPGRTTGTARLLVDLVNGRLPVLVDTWISVVDVRDCGRGHVLAEAFGVPGERYLLSGPSIPIRDAVDILRRVWGRPARVRWVPASLARLAGTGTEAVGRLLRRDVPLCREVVRALLHGHRYDGSRAERELHLRYTPLQETLERTLRWYAGRGLVAPPGPRGRRARP